MARKPFLVRLDPALLAAVEAWAADDLRSTNGQIEFLLRDALRRAGRKVRADAAGDAATAPGEADGATAPAASRGRRRTGT